MKAGLIIFLVGLVLVAYTYINYLWASNKLSQLKKEDLVSYYLDLAQFLYPVPFWSGVIGMVAIVIALIVVLINIPAVF
ncbi:MAG: hypothetical protein ACOX6F_03690 [Syntrophomonadaceae bacterium]|nr:hypothetical protein [Bacillota bacterium]NLM87908.1 hypothetical protein [Syntrophomonadaceae bacterium]HAA09227.1 hypothetical protein [Syntrophomonas sp.]HQA49271.1 hypothetical protein [Syntrophomonadaceae bacterium]HQD90007.1 hypothetical protein [Syntrophomonadaceae bacterium]